jgi:putative alpha-1,2-mannosidase
MHRYGFPAGGHLLIDFDHAMQLPHHHHTRVEGMLQQLAPDLLVGSRRVHQWANGREIHFAMRLSVPAAEMRFFAHDAPAAAGATGLVGGGLKVAIMLPDAASAPVMVKVGMSGVDLAGAMANLTRKCPTGISNAFAGPRARRGANGSTACALSVAPAERRIMATALYHAAAAPNLFADADGRYRGMDRAVHTLAKGKATGAPIRSGTPIARSIPC